MMVEVMQHYAQRARIALLFRLNWVRAPSHTRTRTPAGRSARVSWLLAAGLTDCLSTLPCRSRMS